MKEHISTSGSRVQVSKHAKKSKTVLPYSLSGFTLICDEILRR
jgi:hypothetical protein